MSAVLAAPPAAPASAPRSRRWPVLLAGLVAMAGLAVSGLVAWAPTTADLAVGRASFGGTAEVVGVDGYGPDGTDVSYYVDGGTVDVTVPVRNDGPLPLTVTSAATGAGVLPLLEVRSVDGVPLRLGPGEQGELVLRGVMSNCAYYHEREAQYLRELVLGVDVAVPLAAARTVTVPLQRPLLVRSPMIVTCPDRKLNRQADDRTDAL